MFEAGNSPGLIIEIQSSAIDENSSSSSLLAKAKVAASKLNQVQAVDWIEAELNGYRCPFEDLPTHRKSHGELRLKNPYHGLIPYLIADAKTEELVTRTPISQGVGEIEALIASPSSDGTFTLPLSNAVRNLLIEWQKKQGDLALEPILIVSQTSLVRVLQRTRTLVLDWALELERKGILGEEMTFSREDRERATQATQNVFAQNIGILGSASDSATVSNIQVSGDQSIDQRELADFISEARRHLPMLPNDIAQLASKALEEVESAKSDEEKRGALASLRAILEGAAGNMSAQGIIQAISSIF